MAQKSCLCRELVAWRRGVLAKGHRPRGQTRMAQEAVHKRARSADAGPVVVPQSRNQPGAVGGEHQVGQGAFPERPVSALAPSGGLLRSRLDQHVIPPRIQGHLRGIGEDDVIGTGVEIPKPPRLSGRLLAQQCEQEPVMLVLPPACERQHNRGLWEKCLPVHWACKRLFLAFGARHMPRGVSGMSG
jgi:hypothetical protein